MAHKEEGNKNLVTHPKTYLLQAIIGYKENEYKSFGELHAKHVDDIVLLLKNYGIEVAENVLTRAGNGEIKFKRTKN
jgi:hypothetical protein